MSGSRAATASHSRRVKERLVKILYGKDYSRQGRDAHQKLDFASYTYDELRQSYIQKVQILHPDKFQSNELMTMDKKEKSSANDSQQEEWGDVEPTSWQSIQETMKQQNHRDRYQAFVDLKEAWDEYEKIAKVMKRGSGRETQSNFTMFGVGCSFSDNPDEQQRRAEIMDQACRGWFSAGQLPAENEKDKRLYGSKEAPSWSSNSELDGEKDFQGRNHQEGVSTSLSSRNTTQRKSLIDHLILKRD
mmetsp:Transcript_12237/g.22941  ORF Transcript_12237/g.22941 Transcript_12237/m.22941 type:complete len:246 (+) Transcript_12237:38-775(+)